MPRIIADSIDQWISIEMRYAAQVLCVGGTSARTEARSNPGGHDAKQARVNQDRKTR
jgi:hypothetical protein